MGKDDPVRVIGPSGRQRALAGVIAALLCLPAATACHEVIGHGLTGVLAGGRIVSVDILFLQVWPRVRIHPWEGRYGQCSVEGIPSQTGELLMELGGSMSTCIASIVALVLLRVRHWSSPWVRAPLLAVGLWWIDLLTYTLPTWGIRRSILWGDRYAEPYEAAVALGVPGRLFQAGVVILSVTLAIHWFICLMHHGARARRQGELGM